MSQFEDLQKTLESFSPDKALEAAAGMMEKLGFSKDQISAIKGDIKGGNHKPKPMRLPIIVREKSLFKYEIRDEIVIKDKSMVKSIKGKGEYSEMTMEDGSIVLVAMKRKDLEDQFGWTKL